MRLISIFIITFGKRINKKALKDVRDDGDELRIKKTLQTTAVYQAKQPSAKFIFPVFDLHFYQISYFVKQDTRRNLSTDGEMVNTAHLEPKTRKEVQCKASPCQSLRLAFYANRGQVFFLFVYVIWVTQYDCSLLYYTLLFHIEWRSQQ